jgi:HupE / UreJ protein
VNARGLVRAALALIATAWLALPAAAHQSSDAYLRASADAQGRVALQLDVALRDLDVLLDLDTNADGQLSWGEVRQREAEIAGHVAAHLRMDEGRCKLQAQPGLALDRKADGVYAVLRFASDCVAAAGPSLAYGLMREADPTHRGLLAVLDTQGRVGGTLRSLPPGGEPVRLAFDGAVPSNVAAAQAEATPSGGFFADGLHHILIGPDHVLFIVCLLLPLVLITTPGSALRSTRPPRGLHVTRGSSGAAVWPIVALVTAFTVGHSITLGLASLRILSLSPSIIEPLIALTIALTALDNVRPFFRGPRAVPAFVFGLIHGFGFAGPLIELDLAPGAMAWALLQFNLGVEAGQLVVVALAMLLLWPLRGRPLARQVLVVGSATAGLVALLWFAERVLGFKLLPF